MRNNHPKYNHKFKIEETRKLKKHNNSCYKSSSPSDLLALQSLCLPIVSKVSQIRFIYNLNMFRNQQGLEFLNLNKFGFELDKIIMDL